MVEQVQHEPLVVARHAEHLDGTRGKRRRLGQQAAAILEQQRRLADVGMRAGQAPRVGGEQRAAVQLGALPVERDLVDRSRRPDHARPARRQRQDRRVERHVQVMGPIDGHQQGLRPLDLGVLAAWKRLGLHGHGPDVHPRPPEWLVELVGGRAAGEVPAAGHHRQRHAKGLAGLAVDDVQRLRVEAGVEVVAAPADRPGLGGGRAAGFVQRQARQLQFPFAALKQRGRPAGIEHHQRVVRRTASPQAAPQLAPRADVGDLGRPGQHEPVVAGGRVGIGGPVSPVHDGRARGAVVDDLALEKQVHRPARRRDGHPIGPVPGRRRVGRRAVDRQRQVIDAERLPPRVGRAPVVEGDPLGLGRGGQRNLAPGRRKARQADAQDVLEVRPPACQQIVGDVLVGTQHAGLRTGPASGAARRCRRRL